MSERPLVGILLFDQVEVLDWAGPYEVFAMAKDEQEQPYFRAVTVAETPTVTCAGGVRVLADHTFDTCPDLEILIVPGGPGARAGIGHEALQRFILTQHERVALLASVCTGSFILARTGLLDGKPATTHSNRLQLFRDHFPNVDLRHEKLIATGKIITAGGVSSGIDLALHILEQRFGPAARAREAKRLDGPWH